MDKAVLPDDEGLKQALGATFNLWQEIIDFVYRKCPKVMTEWNYPGKNYGWSFRLKDKKRVIIYLLPRDGFFKVAFVFGQKACDTIMTAGISDQIKSDLSVARVYAEGRGIRIDVTGNSVIADIKKLIEIKLFKLRKEEGAKNG
jgi:hypothetical protein